MWPWNHVAVAYLLASAVVERREGRPPSDGAAVAAAGGALAPDVVDKSLSWLVPVLPGGRSLAHSALVAVPVAALAVALARRRGRESVGVAAAVGYLSHLPLDALGSGLIDGDVETGFLLWPLLPTATSRPDAALAHLLELLGRTLAFATTPLGLAYIAGTAALLGVTAWVWLRDGRPGPGLVTGRA